MQLFVMPVTTKLLTEPYRAMEVELPLAKEKHIPVLPLMMEQGIDDVFAKHFGDLQYLDPNNTDETTGTLQAYRDLVMILLVLGAFYFDNRRKRFGFLQYTDKQKKKKAKEMFERAVEIVKTFSDEYLNELGEKAQKALDEYF